MLSKNFILTKNCFVKFHKRGFVVFVGKIYKVYTVNKLLGISHPQPVCHLPNSPWLGIMYPIPVPGRFGQK